MALPIDEGLCYLIEPFGTTAGRIIPHTGDDWARRKVNGKIIAEAPNVYSVRAGTVVFAEPHGVAGNRIIIDYGGVYGDYGHLKAFAVKKGQKVKERQLIGMLGGTGKVTGPHLHYTEGTNLDRLLKGVYPYWKDPKTGRVLWASADAWASASGLRRPSYESDPKSSVSGVSNPNTEEDDMFTDNDRYMMTLNNKALGRIELKLSEITNQLNAIQSNTAVNKWALVDEAQGLRRMVADALNAIKSIPGAGSVTTATLALSDEDVQRVADAVVDEQRDRLAE